MPRPREPERGLVDVFLSSLRELRAEAYVLDSEGATEAAIKKILAEKNCNLAVIAGLPGGVKRVVERALQGHEYCSAEELPVAKAVNTIARADVGVTWGEYGVAREGAIMEVVYDDAVKLASSLPLHHIVLLRTGSLLADLSQAMAEVGRITGSSPADRKPVISFISGPSKTGDIEMKLLYGVHGPNTLSVLLLSEF